MNWKVKAEGEQTLHNGRSWCDNGTWAGTPLSSAHLSRTFHPLSMATSPEDNWMSHSKLAQRPWRLLVHKAQASDEEVSGGLRPSASIGILSLGALSVLCLALQ